MHVRSGDTSGSTIVPACSPQYPNIDKICSVFLPLFGCTHMAINVSGDTSGSNIVPACSPQFVDEEGVTHSPDCLTRMHGTQVS